MRTNSLNIVIASSPDEAPDYKKDFPGFKAADIEKVIIVCNGTATGRATVDFQIEDQEGNMFVTMLTGALIKNLAAAIEGAEQRSRRA